MHEELPQVTKNDESRKVLIYGQSGVPVIEEAKTSDPSEINKDVFRHIYPKTTGGRVAV